jgi:hypothetical protein
MKSRKTVFAPVTTTAKTEQGAMTFFRACTLRQKKIASARDILTDRRTYIALFFDVFPLYSVVNSRLPLESE